MPSATVLDQYLTIGAILDPPWFSLDTTFNYTFISHFIESFLIKLDIKNTFLSFF